MAQVSDDVIEGLGVTVNCDHRRAVGSEGDRALSTDAASRPNDSNPFASQIEQLGVIPQGAYLFRGSLLP